MDHNDVQAGPLDGERRGAVEPQGVVIRSGPLVTALMTNADGQITGKVERLGGRETRWRYVYDVDGRLWGTYRDGRLAEAYQYDAATGVRTLETSGPRGVFEREYEYGPGLRLLSAGDARYAYDDDGRLVARTAEGGGVDRFTYGADGRMRSARMADGELVEYDYDAEGRLDSRWLDGVRVHVFEWEGMRLTNFFNGAYHAFEYGDGRMPVAMVRNGTERFTLGFDQVGSLRAVADGSGNLVKAVKYDSWGNILKDTNPGLEVPFGFAGGVQDRRTGLVTFLHRHYDPSVARWTTPDPIGYEGGDEDLYGYCLDDPIGLNDPLGLGADDWWDVGGMITKVRESASAKMEEIKKSVMDRINEDERIKKARAIAKEVGPNHPGHNNKGDAMRHAEWNRRMVKEIGPEAAYLVGVGHELEGLAEGQPINEALMDLHNNRIGRQAGVQGKQVDKTKLQTGLNQNPDYLDPSMGKYD